MNSIKFLLPGLFVLSIMACTRGFEPIEYGKDACANCKMTIVDNRFAAEMVTNKGKVFKFDDITCLKHYQTEHPENENALLFIEDYLNKSDKPLDAKQAVFLHHDFFGSPMNGNYAAFSNEKEAQQWMDSLKVQALSWDGLK